MTTQATDYQDDKRSDTSQAKDRDRDGDDPEAVSKEIDDHNPSGDSETSPTTDNGQEKDIETGDDPSVKRPDIVASEDYSVFTVGQKRSIILAGSFVGWFSPVS